MGRDFFLFFFKYLKKLSRRLHCKYLYTTLYIAKADVWEIFLSISQQIKVNGVTGRGYFTITYHFIMGGKSFRMQFCGSILVSLGNCLQLCSEREIESLSFVLLDDTWSQ